MTSDPEIPSDQPADEQRLKDLSLRFREAWQDVRGMGGSVDLVPFLPASGDPLRARALEKLVAIDLHYLFFLWVLLFRLVDTKILEPGDNVSAMRTSVDLLVDV